MTEQPVFVCNITGKPFGTDGMHGDYCMCASCVTAIHWHHREACRMLAETTARAEKAEAENKQLREALQGFLNEYEYYVRLGRQGNVVHMFIVHEGLTIKKMRAALKNPFCTSAEAENARLRAAKAIVNEQAEDDGCWFIAETAAEAYLQQELRRLHAALEIPND